PLASHHQCRVDEKVHPAFAVTEQIDIGSAALDERETRVGGLHACNGHDKCRARQKPAGLARGHSRHGRRLCECGGSEREQQSGRQNPCRHRLHVTVPAAACEVATIQPCPPARASSSNPSSSIRLDAVSSRPGNRSRSRSGSSTSCSCWSPAPARSSRRTICCRSDGRTSPSATTASNKRSPACAGFLAVMRAAPPTSKRSRGVDTALASP